jgi:uncharacterized protein YkwD
VPALRAKPPFRLATLAALACAAVPAVVPATASAGSASASMLNRINAVRAAHGLPALSNSPTLRHGAYRHSRSMLVHGYFAHSSLTGQARAEIIERHSGEDPRVGYALRAWLNSPGHRRVILMRGLRKAGAGVSTTRGNTAWTVRFG